MQFSIFFSIFCFSHPRSLISCHFVFHKLNFSLFPICIPISISSFSFCFRQKKKNSSQKTDRFSIFIVFACVAVAIYSFYSSSITPSSSSSNSNSEMNQRVGGLKPAQPITEEVKSIALQVKADAEQKAGRSFSTYNPVRFSSQLVAGTNFFIDVDVGEGQHVHLRVYRDLKNNVSLASIKTGLTASDEIQYF